MKKSLIVIILIILSACTFTDITDVPHWMDSYIISENEVELLGLNNDLKLVPNKYTQEKTLITSYNSPLPNNRPCFLAGLQLENDSIEVKINNHLTLHNSTSDAIKMHKMGLGTIIDTSNIASAYSVHYIDLTKHCTISFRHDSLFSTFEIYGLDKEFCKFDTPFTSKWSRQKFFPWKKLKSLFISTD